MGSLLPGVGTWGFSVRLLPTVVRAGKSLSKVEKMGPFFVQFPSVRPPPREPDFSLDTSQPGQVAFHIPTDRSVLQ
jgi:hypothetical protein